MAILQNFVCKKCMKQTQEAHPGNWHENICCGCKTKEENKKELMWKMEKETLSIEDRIREIEDFIYHHGTHYRGPVTFG